MKVGKQKRVGFGVELTAEVPLYSEDSDKSMEIQFNDPELTFFTEIGKVKDDASSSSSKKINGVVAFFETIS